MPYLLLGFLLAGLFLIWLGRRRQLSAGLPLGRVIAIDTLRLTGVEEPIYDPVLDLTGRPDYLVRAGRQVVPVEVKSGRAHAGPLPGHVLQLAAYCRLVHAQTSSRTLEAMRAAGAQLPPRSHESPPRCRACGVRHVCDQRLENSGQW